MMCITVCILYFFLTFVISVSDENGVYRPKVKAHLRSASWSKDINRLARRSWKIKQAFGSHGLSSPPAITWQNSVEKFGKVAGLFTKEDGKELESDDSSNPLFDFKVKKLGNSKLVKFDQDPHRKDKRKMNDRKNLTSTPAHKAIIWGFANTGKLNVPISQDIRRKTMDSLQFNQVSKVRHLTSNPAASSFDKKHLKRRKRFASIPSMQELFCDKSVSCHKRCSSSFQVSYNEELSCYCDIHCEYFQDCCYDFDKFCQVSNGTVTQKNSTDTSKPDGVLDNHQRRTDSKHWNCHNLTGRLKSTKGIWMISSCPLSWPKDNIYYRCRNLSVLNTITLENYQYPPVYTNSGIVYHNQFCAECHGVSSQERKPYQLSLSCDVTPPDYLNSMNKLKFLFNYCSKITWKPNKGDPRRYGLEIVTSCPVNPLSKGECLNNPARLVNDHKCIYKNIKCAACHGKDTSRMKCGPDILSINDTCVDAAAERPDLAKPKPISIILDFTNPGSMKVDCKTGYIFDDHLETCRKTLSSIPRQSEIEQYRIVLWIETIGNKSGQQVSNALHGMNTSVLVKNLAQALQVFPSQIENVSVDTEEISIQKIEFDFKDTNSNHSDVLEKILNFTSHFNLTIANFAFIIIKATKIPTHCPSIQLYHSHEYAPASSSSVVHIKNTGELLRYADYYDIETDSANRSRGILVCRKIAKCAGTWILLEENDFTVMANRSLFVKASKIIYGTLKQYWQNRTVFVCTNYPSKSPSFTEKVLTILTIFCMSISIAALVFVLITYSLFAELRTTPGINLMNLSFSILLGQLMWLFGNGQTAYPTACTAIAILLHYLFLVSFVWTSIIAFDTWRAFQCSHAPNRVSVNIKRRLRAAITGWVPAMLYVAICYVLDATNTFTIGYPSPNACWITNLYFFAVPMGCCLLFNIVFYLLTLKAIKTATAQARVAVDHKNSTKLFGAYVRIASTMGFTWFTGFLITLSTVFSYFFVVLSGFQGVYIALAFGLNQRARSLYINRYAFLACTISSGSDDRMQSLDKHHVDTTDTQL